MSTGSPNSVIQFSYQIQLPGWKVIPADYLRLWFSHRIHWSGNHNISNISVWFSRESRCLHLKPLKAIGDHWKPHALLESSNAVEALRRWFHHFAVTDSALNLISSALHRVCHESTRAIPKLLKLSKCIQSCSKRFSSYSKLEMAKLEIELADCSEPQPLPIFSVVANLASDWNVLVHRKLCGSQ